MLIRLHAPVCATFHFEVIAGFTGTVMPPSCFLSPLSLRIRVEEVSIFSFLRGRKYASRRVAESSPPAQARDAPRTQESHFNAFGACAVDALSVCMLAEMLMAYYYMPPVRLFFAAMLFFRRRRGAAMSVILRL